MLLSRLGLQIFGFIFCLMLFTFFSSPVYSALSPLKVSGNHFQDSNGNIIILRGAARWSLEFSCGDGHFGISDFQAMKSWGMTVVRIPLNENEFLTSSICNGNYQQTVFNAVSNAEAAGLYVLLDLHWIHPVELTNRDNRGGQFPMPDNQAIVFWQTLAGKYKNDPQVMFEFMNEPHSTPCNVWRDGGTVNSQGGTGWIGQTAGTYQTPGFQKFVDLVRGLGANNVIIQGASGESDLSCAVSNPLSDPANNLAYQSHFYSTNPSGGWQNTFQSLLNKTPVIAGEFDTVQARPVINLFENTLKTGYIAWAWHTGEIINDYTTGQPTAAWQFVHDFMLAASKNNPPIPTQQTTSPSLTNSPPNMPSLTLSLTPSNTLLNINFVFEGIGPQNNSNPQNLSRQVILDFYRSGIDDWSNDPLGKHAYIKTVAIVNYNNNSTSPMYGYFSGVAGINIGNTTVFDILAKSPQGSLRKLIVSNTSITPGQNVTLPNTNLIMGDINGDNKIDILDYNMVKNCFETRASSSICNDPNKLHPDRYKNTLYSDITDSGIVEGVAYTISIKNFGKVGDGGLSSSPISPYLPTPTPGQIYPSIPNGTSPTTNSIPNQPVSTTYQKGINETPPMGADPWLIYHDNLKILNEKYFMQMADFMHTQKFPIWDGTQKTMQEVGYNYVTINDAWQGTRQGSNPLPPNPNFANIGNTDPSIGFIAHAHSLGLKTGIYTDMGTKVCVPQTNGPQSGSQGYEMTDGGEFQQWGADYLELDYCSVNTSKISCPGISDPYECDLSIWRKAVGPNILLYMNTAGGHAPWTWAAKDNSVNTWRVNQPAQDAWSGSTGSVMDTLDGSGSYLQKSNAVPYHWSDANYLAVGIKNLTLDESKSQFSMWAMVTSQLIASNDILLMKPGDIASQVLFNTEVIAIDQDPNVVQATKQTTINGVEVWEKSLAGNQYAIAFLNTNNNATSVTVQLSQVGLPSTVNFRDLWQHKPLPGPFTNSFTTTNIPPHGIQLLKTF